MHVLAHQGGWDEILMVLAPIVVIAGLVRVVQRRAERAHAATDDHAEVESADHSGPG